MGEGVEEGVIEGCGSTLNSLGVGECAGGVLSGGWGCLGIESSKSFMVAATESHHAGKGQTDEASTFVKCAEVSVDAHSSSGDTFTEGR